MKTLRAVVLLVCLALTLAASAAGCGRGSAEDGPGVTPPTAAKPLVSEMMARVSETNIENSTLALQDFGTRAYPASGFTPGNERAGTWIYSQLDAIPGLTVAYQSAHRNVIATLPGDSTVYMVGAHYDDLPLKGPAPGASDDGVGVAMVLEMARVMSQYKFTHTIIFAFCNGEEGGQRGSHAYVDQMLASSVDLGFYHNIDSPAYDPDGELSLDIVSNARSSWVADLFDSLNTLYGTGFTLTRNGHDCVSDHRPFWEDGGYTATFTHSNGGTRDGHSPFDHSSRDIFSPGNVSTAYAQRHCQLAMAVLANSAMGA